MNFLHAQNAQNALTDLSCSRPWWTPVGRFRAHGITYLPIVNSFDLTINRVNTPYNLYLKIRINLQWRDCKWLQYLCISLHITLCWPTPCKHLLYAI